MSDLEDIYKKKPEWIHLDSGGVLSVPVEELRMTNLPKPDCDGRIDFSKKKGANLIQNFPVGQTIENLNGSTWKMAGFYVFLWRSSE